MTTTTTKQINRGHLLRAARKGQLFVRCRYHLTDDYAFDNANNCGKMDGFKRVYLREPHDSPLAQEVHEHYQNGGTWADIQDKEEALREERQQHDREQRRKAEGMVMMGEWEFRSKSGHVRGDKECGNFSVHSNLCYEYEIRV